jgi:hypothetical protein
MHIPANMMLFSVVLSLTIVTAFHKRRDADNRQKKVKSEERIKENGR